MTARLLRPIQRLAAMDREELRFRALGEGRKAAARIAWSVRVPRWNRSALTHILRPASASPALASARAAAASGRWMDAHRALASHFASRDTAFPLQPRKVDELARRIRTRFPEAVDDSRARAVRVLEGRYDLLGYAGLDFGSPPRWHWDPVHLRTAPGGFWSSVPYLFPSSGDHKIIWEINRHQHWLALARAYYLTGDRVFYEVFVDQFDDWMRANPPLAGINWASMLELGFRSLSWLWALHFFAPVAAAAPDGERSPWLVDLLIGLDRQVTHIEHNLSRYFSPNTHLTGEALAVYVAGATLPELASSGRRIARGRDVLVAETKRQVLGDGGHVERSAHYHRYSTDFYLLALMVARGADDRATATLGTAARAQARYLRTLADDGGRLPLIGDDDGGQLFPMCGRPPADCRDTLATAAIVLDEPALATGPAPEETYWLCGHSEEVEQLSGSAGGWLSTVLPDSGYFVSRTRAGDHLVLDAGPHGYLNGGHAHADALSVVLTVGGRPLLVDPGTATYTMDPRLRDLFRSTAMHNTVVVNGRGQSQPNGPFHWQSRCDGELTVSETASGFDYAEGRHEGYAPVIHVRSVAALHGLGWFIVDHLLGPGELRADAYWHLDPAWQVRSALPSSITLGHRDGSVQRIAASEATDVLEGADAAAFGYFAPAYGRIDPAPCLRTRTTGPLPRSVLTFIPAEPLAKDSLAVERVAISSPPAPAWHAAAFMVRLGDRRILVLASVEADGSKPAQRATPGRVWGTSDTTTDARVALVTEGPGGTTWKLVNGTVVDGRALLAQP